MRITVQVSSAILYLCPDFMFNILILTPFYLITQTWVVSKIYDIHYAAVMPSFIALAGAFSLCLYINLFI